MRTRRYVTAGPSAVPQVQVEHNNLSKPPANLRACLRLREMPRCGLRRGRPELRHMTPREPPAAPSRTRAGRGDDRGTGKRLARRPHCGNVLAKIVKSDSRVWIDLTGHPHSGSHRLAARLTR